MNKKWIEKIRRKKSEAGKPEGRQSKKRESKSKKQKKEETREEEQERIRQRLRLHVKELTEEMNLRLVLDLQSEVESENLLEEMWLWVESISVVYMEFPQKKRKRFFRPFPQIGSRVREAGKKCYSLMPRCLRRGI